MEKQEINGIEITCPYCLMQFGGAGAYFTIGGKVSHIDIFFSSEAGQSARCEQANIKDFLQESGNGVKEEYKDAFRNIEDAFLKDPSHFSEKTVDRTAFIIGFMQVLNYGDLEGDSFTYNREAMSQESILEQYESGMNLKECLLSYLV